MISFFGFLRFKSNTLKKLTYRDGNIKSICMHYYCNLKKSINFEFVT